MADEGLQSPSEIPLAVELTLLSISLLMKTLTLTTGHDERYRSTVHACCQEKQISNCEDAQGPFGFGAFGLHSNPMDPGCIVSSGMQLYVRTISLGMCPRNRRTHPGDHNDHRATAEIVNLAFGLCLSCTLAAHRRTNSRALNLRTWGQQVEKKAEQACHEGERVWGKGGGQR
jgi:hypothetical protein